MEIAQSDSFDKVRDNASRTSEHWILKEGLFARQEMVKQRQISLGWVSWPWVLPGRCVVVWSMVISVRDVEL